MTCSVNVFIVRLEHAILYPERINTKKAQWVVWDGSKIIWIVWLWEKLMFCTRFKQGKRVFLLSVSRCGISRRQAHVSGVTRLEGGNLNYELVFGECFPLDMIREIPAWPRKNGSYRKKLLPTRKQNWTRNFLCTVCWIECWQPIYAQHILLVKHWGNLVAILHKYLTRTT